ncbi:hypothetical protein ACQX0N_04360 [Clostridium tepidum]|jgi:hypothetical protein|uniref:DUF8042 domain-containing protein n=1 Tax=Clostridium tepidum TaxID=1962263 RepID=A0A1S9IHU1_9CLOT|nr:hypothetical protein [Clostridium tepidum]MDU6876797.1 hypothetical protein [Clostridium botulinum]OOO63617.1 hypothetical protein BS637_00910 [Clostridium tepidum]OOO69765.1 hypothetical protein BS638_01460 [Clostridium tepidum]
MEKTFEEQQFETLKTADEYISKLINGVDICISNIKENKYYEALNLFYYIIEGIDWLNEVARLTKDIQKQNMDEELMKENVEELYNYLNIEDFEKILKLLSEEILPLLNIWQTIIKKSIVS